MSEYISPTLVGFNRKSIREAICLVVVVLLNARAGLLYVHMYMHLTHNVLHSSSKTVMVGTNYRSQ